MAVAVAAKWSEWLAQMTVRTTATGLVFEEVGQRGIHFGGVEFGETGMLWMLLAVPYRKENGDGEFFIIGFVTPVDFGNSKVHFWRIRKTQGFELHVWRFRCRDRLEGLHWDVLEQGRAVIGSLARQARRREALCQHDVGIARVRRRMEQVAARHIETRAQRRAA